MNEGPRYATLRDYLGVLRAHAWLILVVAAVFAGVAYASSTQKQKVYQAETSLRFRDINEEVELLGEPTVPQGGAQRATINADLATQPVIARRVKRALHSRLSIDTLTSKLNADPEATTNFVVLQVKDTSPVFAAKLANEFARQLKIVQTTRERRNFTRAARSLRRQFKRGAGKLADRFERVSFEQRVARIDALADFARPVEIVRSAEVPEHAISPKPVRDGVLGLLIGLTLGILAAFVRDTLDRRIRRPGDIQAQLGLPVIGQLREEALGSGGLEHRGQRPLSARDFEAIQILRANLEFLDLQSRLRCIAVTSPGPEEGKTTVAAALARAQAVNGKRTLLIECDLRRPVLAGRLGLRPTPGLADYLAGRASTQDVLLRVGEPDGSHPENGNASAADGSVQGSYDCIVAGEPTARPAEVVGSSRFRDFLAVATRSYDCVILDCSPILSVVDTLELLPIVDAVVLCVRSSRTTRDQARAAKAAMDRMPRRPTGLVITGLSRRDEGSYHYYGDTAPAAEPRDSPVKATRP